MSDEQIEVTPLHFVTHAALTIDEWPPYTALSEKWLTMAHVYHATVEGDEVRFRLGNGEARYLLRRDLPAHPDGIVAELVESNDKVSLRSRSRKYAIRGGSA